LDRVLLLRYERLVRLLSGADPIAGVGSPAHVGLVAEGDVVDVDEDLFAALPVPDLLA